MEKRLVFPATTLSGFFWAVIHWVMISDSLPWSRPSLLGLAAGVVCPHLCEEERRVTGRAGLRSAGEMGGGREGGDEKKTCLHCTARMATDPEIAGV